MEGVVTRPNNTFWAGKRVFLTGHTGFKGAWLALWLHQLGAVVWGYSLAPPTRPSLFEVAGVGELVHSIEGDIRDPSRVAETLRTAAPEVVIHLAAQSLVRPSYERPLDTYAINVMGTANLLEGVRYVPGVKAVIVVTSDKCYENRGLARGYVESDPLGGADPYSSSKAGAEIVTAAYRRSFFGNACAIASARAGNVIGGGDWAADRLVPDIMRAFQAGVPLRLRYPEAIRPWQHVLDSLAGYLLLAERLVADGAGFAQAWNFGPNPVQSLTVAAIADRIMRKWGGDALWERDSTGHPAEAAVLALDASRARRELGWSPLLNLEAAIDWSVDWYWRVAHGMPARELTLEQIDRYMALT